MDNQPQPAGGFDPNQYNFITDPAAKPKKSLFPSAGSNKTQRILIVFIAVVVLITVIILVAGLIFGGEDNTSRMTSIAKKQQEIAKIAEIGGQKGQSIDSKSFALATKVTVVSDQNSIREYLGTQGKKLNEKELAVNTSEVEQKLATAEQNGTFDTAFNTAMKELLQEYSQNLQSAFNSTSGNNARQLLSSNYDNSVILLESAP